MKPVVNVAVQRWAIAVSGAILVGVAALEHITWQSVLGVVGAVLIGTLREGPDQISLSTLPKELAEYLRGQSESPPPIAATPLPPPPLSSKPELDPLQEGPAEGPTKGP